MINEGKNHKILINDVSIVIVVNRKKKVVRKRLSYLLSSNCNDNMRQCVGVGI